MSRFKNKGNLLIDLTSLLDVIFIVLLVVMSMLQEQESVAAEEKKGYMEQEANISHLEEQYNDQLDAISNIDEYIAFISVNARFDEDLVTRHIEILNSDKSSIVPEIPELKRTKTSEAYSSLKDYIEAYIKENPERVVVLSLNEGDEDILYRDEKEIKSIFNILETEYSNNVRQK